MSGLINAFTAVYQLHIPKCFMLVIEERLEKKKHLFVYVLNENGLK